ncbi:MAG TPA: 3-dehydro-L-gulonate 2-dehydrogenase [Ohtaekwangia sp.]|nr:3-dehydro-L-gulonate 2-dehydrogenase [Ohtaekwangia sp.]
MSKDPSGFIRIQHDVMLETFYQALLRIGFSEEKALQCAEIFATNSLEGIYTHGVNRFPRFISYIRSGYIDIHAEASFKSSAGCLEQWDGNAGPGPLNAVKCTDRAMQLAKQYGMGTVALANTNHWMRGGYYGWQAARAGFVFLAWTNTTGNMPAWGAVDGRLGNNPLVIAVPYKQEAIVLDMAMSQYSYGSLDLYKTKKEKLPTPGGYDTDGKLTDDAEAILESRRALPVGFWKGAGLSLLLDVMATILSGGLSTADISKQNAEHALSQVFMAIDISKLGNFPLIEGSLNQIIRDYHHSAPEVPGRPVRYPGERIARTRGENLTQGIPVSGEVWEEIKRL